VANPLRLAVTQTTVPEDPADPGALRESGAQIRALMRDAHASGAMLAQFPEGALVYPSKRLMSSAGPADLAEADWSRANWDVLRAEAEAVAALAAELELWTVFGSLHPLTPPRRPHNSMYVISPSGAVVTRYDKRYLSNSEISWMYTPGIEPVVFEAEGVRFGCAVCIEVHFPEVFAEYERIDADCVLVSVMVDDPIRPLIAQAYAALHSYWVGYSTPAQYSGSAPAGIVAPGGQWIARCPANGQPAVTVADLDLAGKDPDIDVALRLARPWRRSARAGLYDDRQAPEDPRSNVRTSF
jgi:predicted amidohydrolase